MLKLFGNTFDVQCFGCLQHLSRRSQQLYCLSRDHHFRDFDHRRNGGLQTDHGIDDRECSSNVVDFDFCTQARIFATSGEADFSGLAVELDTLLQQVQLDTGFDFFLFDDDVHDVFSVESNNLLELVGSHTSVDSSSRIGHVLCLGFTD